MVFRRGNGNTQPTLGHSFVLTCLQGTWMGSDANILYAPCPALLAVNSPWKMDAVADLKFERLVPLKIRASVHPFRKTSGRPSLRVANTSKKEPKDITLMNPGEARRPTPTSPPTLREKMDVGHQTSPSDLPVPASSVDLSPPPPRCAGCKRHAGPSADGWAGSPMDFPAGAAVVVTAGDLHRCKDPVRLQRFPTKPHVNFGHASASQTKKRLAQISDFKPEITIKPEIPAGRSH